MVVATAGYARGKQRVGSSAPALRELLPVVTGCTVLNAGKRKSTSRIKTMDRGLVMKLTPIPLLIAIYDQYILGPVLLWGFFPHTHQPMFGHWLGIPQFNSDTTCLKIVSNLTG